MRKVFFQMMVTLDGFMEGPTPWDIDWHVVDDDFNRYAAEMLGSIDGILMGRKTYEGVRSVLAELHRCRSSSDERAAQDRLLANTG
jgi:dihydrofolate reductase